MLLHLSGKFLQRNSAITIVIHLLKEEVDLIFNDPGVYYLEELAKLVEVELVIGFQAHAVQ